MRPERTDIAVIGKGLVGSAAARYLALQGHQVTLIGPDEPPPGAEAHLYSSHYDEGRIQRIIGKDPTWTQLNLDSVQAYKALEAESGIDFHQGVGCLYVSPHGTDAYLARAGDDATSFSLSANFFDTAEKLSVAFPSYSFPAGSVGMYEPAPAGLIRPRRLVQAQVSMCEKYGGTVVRQPVLHRETVAGGHLLHLEGGQALLAEKVLVAAGAFANFNGLLPTALDISLKGETIILAEVDDAQAAALIALPSLLYEIFNPELDGIYLIGPLRYPDGKHYLKMGCNLPGDEYFQTLAQVQAWFREPDSEVSLPTMQHAFRQLLPGVQPLSFHTKRCIIHRTPTLRQYIGSGGEAGLYVVAGCNGYSAMSSDALGRLAAHFLVHGTLPAPYEPALFTPRFQGRN